MTFAVLIHHVHGEAALRSTEPHEEVAPGEEPVRRVVESQRPVELRALTQGVGLGAREDEEISHLVNWEREAACEADDLLAGCQLVDPVTICHKVVTICDNFRDLISLGSGPSPLR